VYNKSLLFVNLPNLIWNGLSSDLTRNQAESLVLVAHANNFRYRFLVHIFLTHPQNAAV